jgi:hypothetical protein
MNQAPALCAALVLAGGCVGRITDLSPAPADPDAAAPATDDGAAVGVTFYPTIAADIDALGCSNASCHGGAAPMHLVAGASSATDRAQTYDAFRAHAMSGESSPVLVKNLAGSGVAHGGGSNFASTSDPIYRRWLAWIQAGDPQ